MREFGRKLYAGWMVFGRTLGRINMVILLSVVYVVMLPFFSLMRFKDPLRVGAKRREEPTFWVPVRDRGRDLDAWYRSF